MFKHLEGILWKCLKQHIEVCHTHHRVAATDMVVEEREWLSGTEAFNPQHDLAQLNGIRVVVNGIDTLLYDLTQRLSIVARCGVVLASTHNAKVPGNGSGHGQHKVAAATSGIAHFHVKQRLFSLFSCGASLQLVLNHGNECSLDEAVHQIGTGVVGTGALAVETLGIIELLVGHRNDGTQFQNALIHRAKLFHIQGRVVDFHHVALLTLELVKESKSGEQRLVVDAALAQPWQRIFGKEHTAQGFETQWCTKSLVFKQTECLEERHPQVVILVFLQERVFRQGAEPPNGIVARIDGLPFLNLGVVGVVVLGIKQASVFHDEEEEQLVDEVNEFLVQLLRCKLAVFDGSTKALVVLDGGSAYGFHHLLGGTAEAVADAVARFYALVEIAFKDDAVVATLDEARGV